jgi:hypothetical protein
MSSHACPDITNICQEPLASEVLFQQYLGYFKYSLPFYISGRPGRAAARNGDQSHDPVIVRRVRRVEQPLHTAIYAQTGRKEESPGGHAPVPLSRVFRNQTSRNSIRLGPTACALPRKACGDHRTETEQARCELGSCVRSEGEEAHRRRKSRRRSWGLSVLDLREMGKGGPDKHCPASEEHRHFC